MITTEEKLMKLAELQSDFLTGIWKLADTQDELMEMFDMSAHCICHYVTRDMSDKDKAQYFVNFAYKEKKVCESLENNNV